MKNPGVICLFVVVCMFLSLLFGFFLGRNANSAPIQVSKLDTAPSVTEASQAEQATESTGITMVDINSADLAELQTLPGIGPVLAQRILDYRRENGPFESFSELANVEGIGAGIMAQIAEYVIVGG